MENFNPDDLSRFDAFTIHTTTYKTVSNHPITTDVLIPKTLTSTHPASPSPSPSPSPPRPILLRFHGGGLVGASSLFPDFFAPWHMELALRHAAVIVTPNYRLLPEATVPEIASDIDDLWAWLQAALPAFVANETRGAVAVTADRVVTAGDSAGGYLSLLVALRHPDGVRAATAAYPMLDVRGAHFVQAYDKPMFGLPMLPRSIIDAHLEKVEKGEVPGIVSADPRLERGQLTFACAQHGVIGRAFPAERRDLVVHEALEDGARFPRGGVFVWQGRVDSVVPVEGSVKLEALVRELDPELPFRLYVADGGEHGFDLKSSIEEEWMAEGLRPIVQAWLA